MRGKDQQGHRIQNEDGAQRDRHLLVAAPVIGPTAAMALPPHIAVPVEIRYALISVRTCRTRPSSMPTTMATADAQQRVDKPAAARVHHLVQVHAKAKPDHRQLQQESRDFGRLFWIGMSERASPKASPIANATGGDTKPLAAPAGRRRKTILDDHVEEKAGDEPSPGPLKDSTRQRPFGRIGSLPLRYRRLRRR